MNEVFEFTRKELEEAFKKWNAYYLKNKDDFPDISDQSYIGQANDLITFLKDI